MKPYEFNNESFVSLVVREYEDKWTPVGLQDLSERENKTIQDFIHPLGDPIDGFDLQNLLLVKAEGGIFEAVYGPSFCKTDNGDLVLAMNNNLFPVTLEEGSLFKVGEYEGDFSCETKENNAKDKSWVVAHITLSLPTGGTSYKIPCRLVFDMDISESGIKRAIRNRSNVSDYFVGVGSSNGSGSDTLKMQDIGEGWFQVIGYDTIDIKGRESYILKLEDGRKVWSRGNANLALQAGILISPEKPYKLIVRDLVEKQGKTYLKSGLINMAPVVKASTIDKEDIPY